MSAPHYWPYQHLFVIGMYVFGFDVFCSPVSSENACMSICSRCVYIYIYKCVLGHVWVSGILDSDIKIFDIYIYM
jgi:hypothetical protein